MRRHLFFFLCLASLLGILSSCSAKKDEKVELQVFVAASLKTVMLDLSKAYQKGHSDVTIVYNADSSGKLLTQIQEGFECDIFFSAALKQMDLLEQDGLIVEGTRKNVVNNQLVVLTSKGSNTKITGLENLGEASSLALADGSVPAGRYTRLALNKLGILPESKDVSEFTTKDVSEALNGIEISEQSNVSKVLIAVMEGSCEVGTTYYSDLYGYEDKVEVLQKVSYDLTGDIIYPICRVENKEATSEKEKAAEEFYQFIISDEAKTIFEQYYFDTDIKY